MKVVGAVGCVLALFVLASPVLAGSMLVGDGDFVGWTFGKVVGVDLPVAGVDDALMTTVNDGGNTFIENTTWSNTDGKPAWGFGISTVTWDPSIDGALASVSLEIEFKTGVNPGGDGQAVALLILQNGHYYTLAGGISGVSTPWKLLSFGPLTLADLHNSWAGPSFDVPPQAPDFSATGAPMQFGFAAGNHISTTKSNFYDNWSLLLTSSPAATVPLPSAVLPAGLFLVGMIAVRRIRRKR